MCQDWFHDPSVLAQCTFSEISGRRYNWLLYPILTVLGIYYNLFSWYDDKVTYSAVTKNIELFDLLLMLNIAKEQTSYDINIQVALD